MNRWGAAFSPLTWVRAALIVGLLAGVTERGWTQEESVEGGRPAFAGGRMFQGTVTAASADKVTIKTEQGEQYVVVTTANTRVMKDRQPIKVADITVGSSIGAMGLLDAPTKTVHAMFVTVVDAEQVKKMRENLGKTYILGKVQKIDETTLTILRTDGVTQKIEVDESTSFKRGGQAIRALASGAMMGGFGGGEGRPGRPAGAGAQRPGPPPEESITLMDIKVGDSVGGQGALKGGVFVPKELGVMTPGANGARGGRRRGPDGTPGAAPAPGGPIAPPPAQ